MVKPLENNAIDLSLRVAAANAALEFANAKIMFANAVNETQCAFTAMQEDGRVEGYDEAQRKQYDAWTRLQAVTQEFEYACNVIKGNF